MDGNVPESIFHRKTARAVGGRTSFSSFGRPDKEDAAFEDSFAGPMIGSKGSCNREARSKTVGNSSFSVVEKVSDIIFKAGQREICECRAEVGITSVSKTPKLEKRRR